jgi:O-methyltransferase
MDFERACSLVYLLLQCQNLEGDLVECGTFAGETAVLMGCLSDKRLWLYDSFQGLPSKQAIDGVDQLFREGLFTIDKSVLLKNFETAGLPEPKIIGKWFKDVTDDELPDRVAFAHLDGDFFESIRDSLTLVYPRMTSGGIVLIDDFNHYGLPGVRAAVSEFLRDKPESIVCPIGGKGPDGYRQGPEGLMLHAYFVKH